MQLFCLHLEASCLQLSFLFCLRSYLGTFLLTACSSFFCLQVGFFAYSGKVCLRSTSTDCEQRSSTVSKKTPTVSLKKSTLDLQSCGPATQWKTGRTTKMGKNGKIVENLPRSKIFWKKWPKNTKKWKIGLIFHFSVFFGHFFPIFDRGKFSTIFPFLPIFVVRPVFHCVAGPHDCNPRFQWKGKWCLHIPTYIYIYIYIAPRLICSHNFAPNMLVPTYWNQGIFRLEEEDSKNIKDRNGAQNVVPFWGAIFTIKLGENVPFLSKFVATDRSRAIYIYIYSL